MTKEEEMPEERKTESFSYVITEGKVRITGYAGAKDTVTIPEYLEGYPVTEIGDGAFSKKAAHKQSAGLKRIEMPDTIQKIGRKAFYDTGLEEFSLPEDLESIGEYAFSYCPGPKELRIPPKLAVIEPLRELYGAAAVEVSPDNPRFCAEDGVIFSRDKKKLIWYPAGQTKESYTIPRGVTAIAGRAFEISVSMAAAGHLKKLSMTDEVTCIGDKAFGNCGQLEQIVLSEGLTKIGMSAFFNCGSLKHIHIPPGVTEIAYGLFYMCRQLASVSIPDEVSGIGGRAFYGCRSLPRIRLPESLQELGEYAFHDCQFLTEVEIPSSVEQIGKEAFSECKNLKRVVLPDGIRTIGRRAFFGCRNLRELDVPSSVTEYAQWTKDACILKLRGIPLRNVTEPAQKKLAAIGYMKLRQNGEEILSPYQSGYEEYIRQNRSVFYGMALKDAQILSFLTDAEMIPEEEIDDLIQRANAERNTQAAACLLEYRHRRNKKESGSAWDAILDGTGWFS